MTNMEKLLNKLKNAKLGEPRLTWFKKYLVDVEDKQIWKRRKNDTVVNSFFAVKYQLWQERLVKRVFYVCQKWENKKKKEYVYEIQRYLAGSRYKLNRGIYNASFGGIRLIFWQSFDNCDWFMSTNERYIISNNIHYANYVPVYKLNTYDEALTDSIHKYSAFSYSGLDEENLFWYLYQYDRHPQIEFISKMGMVWLLKGNLNVIRWSQKGFKLFGLDSAKELDQVWICKRFGGLKFYKNHKRDINHYKLDTENRINIYTILSARKFPFSKKTIDYIDLLDNNVSYYSKATDYIDYIGFCEKLGIPLTSSVKYPENFNEAHDEMESRIKIIDKQADTEAIQRQVVERLYKLRFANGKYVITPANSVKDLIDESKALNHCVRSYSERYANGSTSIFLIRDRHEVLTPLYTLELVGKRIEQVRGKNNCDPTFEVKEFVNKWAKVNGIAYG